MKKSVFVQKMFDDIARKYDLLNDILSLGTHRIWKHQVVNRVLKTSPENVLDCATGTGDLAFLLEKKGCQKVTGIDFSREMIEQAKVRASRDKSKANFLTADIMNLPFDSKSFDSTTISFGIRNVEDVEKGLRELSRVSKSLYILEFGQPKNRILSRIYFALLRLYVPIFGLITGRKDAYEYLITSSESFPSGEVFLSLMKKNSDHSVFEFQPIFGGIAYLYYSHGVRL